MENYKEKYEKLKEDFETLSQLFNEVIMADGVSLQSKDMRFVKGHEKEIH